MSRRTVATRNSTTSLSATTGRCSSAGSRWTLSGRQVIVQERKRANYYVDDNSLVFPNLCQRASPRQYSLYRRHLRRRHGGTLKLGRARGDRSCFVFFAHPYTFQAVGEIDRACMLQTCDKHNQVISPNPLGPWVPPLNKFR